MCYTRSINFSFAATSEFVSSNEFDSFIDMIHVECKANRVSSVGGYNLLLSSTQSVALGVLNDPNCTATTGT